MALSVGCFALIDPFSSLAHQLDQIRAWGFRHADVTDNGDGATLGTEFGFGAVASLDANPFDLLRLFQERDLKITSYCAHSNLLDPPAPWRYGTVQILKAVRAAATIGIPHVITTEGEPATAFGQALTESERLFAIREKLYEPLRLAEDCGVKILIEPHGPVTDSLEGLERILEICNSRALGINLDTGNFWLGGGEPLELIRKFGPLIEHVHWKDLPASMTEKRGKIFGCGMSTIALGSGAVNIAEIYAALVRAGFQQHTTLEIAGEAAVKESHAFLQSLGGESRHAGT
jgi:inosose dehydratase